MTETDIPVDLFNPGQVFACLGLMEAAEVLLGETAGRFDWSDEEATRFHLRAAGDKNPVEVVLEFLDKAEVKAYAPKSYVEENRASKKTGPIERLHYFPAQIAEKTKLPARLIGTMKDKCIHIDLTHWTDGSSRDDFKLYAGNRSGDGIAGDMLKDIKQLWKQYSSSSELIEELFDVIQPMGGSFNFDPRAAWTAIDAGYSPNDAKIKVRASPLVELLAALGLEHARPQEVEKRKVRYAVWKKWLPVALARASLGSDLQVFPVRGFRFELEFSGKNKVVTFAQEEPQP